MLSLKIPEPRFVLDEDPEYAASCDLPTPWATFQLHAFVDKKSGKEHLAFSLGDVHDGEPVLARMHSECLTGDALFSQRCDCGAQLEGAMKKIAMEGRGIVLYLRQEGRGIGLVTRFVLTGCKSRALILLKRMSNSDLPPICATIKLQSRYWGTSALQSSGL